MLDPERTILRVTDFFWDNPKILFIYSINSIKKESKMKKLFLLVLVLLAGCGATGAPFVLEKNSSNAKAIIYFYRPSIAINCCVAPNVFVNNHKIGQLKNGGYLSATVSPGSVDLETVNESVGFKPLKLSIEAEAGQTYYFRWSAAAVHTTLGIMSDEAVKRDQEMASGSLEKVLRVTDAKTANNEIIQHERELRLVKANEALVEIGKTKKSD